jgi:hypothetical protein
MALRRAKWTHEFNTKMNLRKVFRHFFGMPQILPSLTKLLPEPEKLLRRSYDGLRCPHEWPDGFTIRAEFDHFLYRVSIWCQFWDSVTPELAPNIPNVSTMPLRLYTMASRLAKNTSRMPPDWTKSARLPIVLNMSKTIGRLCRCYKNCQELSRTTTMALGCHHGYSRITRCLKSWSFGAKIWPFDCRLYIIRDEPWH